MIKKKQIALGVLGGTGYGAGELLRLLVHHPEVQVVSVTSSSRGGERLDSAHPHLRGAYELCFSPELSLDVFEGYSDRFVLFALPHGKSAEAIQGIFKDPRAKEVRCIDLSGDFRLKHSPARQKHYPESFQLDAALVAQFVYGLPELYRDKVSQARFLANPGCLSTAATLAVLPIVQSGFQGGIVFDAKTGTSGAGRAPQETMHHPERHANLAAYKILEHRHEAEVLENLGDPEGKKIQSFFVPHLLPCSRGIFVTAYLTLPKPMSQSAIVETYQNYFSHHPFVRIVEGSPELHAVIGSNYCDIGLVCRGNQLVAMAALDNLVKGMAGLAIQNLNLMAGLEETTGLRLPGLGLV